jgi:hypothetical protein
MEQKEYDFFTDTVGECQDVRNLVEALVFITTDIFDKKAETPEQMKLIGWEAERVGDVASGILSMVLGKMDDLIVSVNEQQKSRITEQSEATNEEFKKQQ